MASGTILNDCSICEGFIWEDQNFVILENGAWLHTECYKENVLCPHCGQYHKLK